QAEDGIRDFHVTGVQTCALPILQGGSELVDFRTPFTNRWGGWYVTGKHGNTLHRGNVFTEEKNQQLVVDFKRGANVTELKKFFEIGRASCRERGWTRAVAGPGRR